MVLDLNAYRSHPNKPLKVHINGVLNKALKRFNSPLVKWASLFHDLGKINPNFQNKLKPHYKGKYVGYDEHAYLSAWAWLCFLEKNLKSNVELKEDLKENVIYLQIILVLIAKHHGNLPNFASLLNADPIYRLQTFLKDQPLLPISAFLGENLQTSHVTFELADKDQFNKLIVFTDQQNWQKKALDYFLDTQFAFASLIEADKRDAGESYIGNYYHLEAITEQSSKELSLNLNRTWQTLDVKFDKSDLDKIRTAIREEAVNNLSKELLTGKRIFTLTAPTGAGKTYALLALAAEIQKQKLGMSILYALPYLSITEQVEDIVRNLLTEVLSATSKSQNQNLDKLIEKLDSHPTERDLIELFKQDFIHQSFDHPFIITTFVQFFEALLSNRNSTLLKLPNFANRIFIIDEIQALPPRLYIFFAAWLEAFCRKWNCYTILSTATMPKMDFENKPHIIKKQKPELLFKNYLRSLPVELLDTAKLFSNSSFNRYCIRLSKPFELSIDQLANNILAEKLSCLVIVNTIKDSKQLYKKLKFSNNIVFLLNTHFIPLDRQKKISLIKDLLTVGEKVILVSTQLIEAGVDIDFPIVYRDLCPLPSLIQSAGRCNRNNRFKELGQVWFFHLKQENGKSGALAVYRDEARLFLEFSQRFIQDRIEEKTLLNIQEQFFRFIADNLIIGEYEIDQKKVNLIELANDAAFETLGKFKLIQEKTFGYEFQYYIPVSYEDNTYKKAVELLELIQESNDFLIKRQRKIQLNQQIKKIMERTITIRAFEKDDLPAWSNEPQYFDIKILSNINLYNFDEGFNHSSTENAFL